MKHHDKIKPYRFRAASSGALTDAGKLIGGDVACPRNVLLRDHGIQEPHDPAAEWDVRAQITFGIGFANEEIFEKRLVAKETMYVREKFICTDLSDQVEFAGSMDFYLPEHDDVYELKMVSSTRRFKETFVDGKVKDGHACQLLNYMIETEPRRGILRYTNCVYHKTANWKAEPTVKSFVFNILEDGTILKDKEPFHISVADILAHRDLVVHCLENQEVWYNRPADDGFFSPCTFCFWNKACEKWDNKGINKTEDFLQECRALCNERLEGK